MQYTNTQIINRLKTIDQWKNRFLVGVFGYVIYNYYNIPQSISDTIVILIGLLFLVVISTMLIHSIVLKLMGVDTIERFESIMEELRVPPVDTVVETIPIENAIVQLEFVRHSENTIGKFNDTDIFEWVEFKNIKSGEILKLEYFGISFGDVRAFLDFNKNQVFVDMNKIIYYKEFKITS